MFEVIISPKIFVIPGSHKQNLLGEEHGCKKFIWFRCHTHNGSNNII